MIPLKNVMLQYRLGLQFLIQRRHPLHLACMSKATPEIIRKLIDIYPNAAAMPDTPEHQLPLHIAVSHCASVEALQVLYEAYPDAIKCHTKTRGFIPLHIACLHKDACSDIVRFLLDKYKDGAMVRPVTKISFYDGRFFVL